MILHYVHYCHPNLKNVVRILGHVWLWILHICQKYAFIINIMAWLLYKKLKDLIQNNQNRTYGEKSNCTYKNMVMTHGRHIYAKAYDMAKVTCMNTHSHIMRYNTGNVYCDVVPNVQSLIFLTRKQIISILTPVLQFVFTFIIWLHVVKNMIGFR